MLNVNSPQRVGNPYAFLDRNRTRDMSFMVEYQQNTKLSYLPLKIRSNGTMTKQNIILIGMFSIFSHANYYFTSQFKQIQYANGLMFVCNEV